MIEQRQLRFCTVIDLFNWLWLREIWSWWVHKLWFWICTRQPSWFRNRQPLLVVNSPFRLKVTTKSWIRTHCQLSLILSMQFKVFSIIFFSSSRWTWTFKQFKYHTNKHYFITSNALQSIIFFYMRFQSIGNSDLKPVSQ